MAAMNSGTHTNAARLSESDRRFAARRRNDADESSRSVINRRRLQPGVLEDDSLNHQTGAWAVSLAKSDPLTVGSSDHFDSVAQKRLPLGAELQLALNLIPAHTWYAAPSGALTFLNRRRSGSLGLPQGHPLRFGIDTGAEWDSHIPLLHPDDHDQTRRVWSTCLRTGSAGEVSFRVRNAEGGYRWFLSRAEPLRAGDATLLYWIGVNLDIEERKRVDVALRLTSRDLQESKSKLEEAQRVAHVGYWEWDLTTDHVIWSDETYRIYGLQPQERPMDLATIRESIHPEDREFVFRKAAEAIQGEVRTDVEHRIVRPSGEVRVVHSQGDLKRDAAGRPWQMFGTAQDITDRKQAEGKNHGKETE